MAINREDAADAAVDALRPQVRLLAVGAAIGAVMLGASLMVDLAGLADPELPRVPGRTPRLPAVPALPSGLPTLPAAPTGLPSGFPSDFPTDLPSGFPTDLPPLPTDLPSLPAFPGGAQ